MGLLEVLFNQLPQPAPYTYKQPLSELERLVREYSATMPPLEAANAALAQVSPAAGKLKQPEKPTGLFNLYNLLKDKVIYRQTW